MLTQGTQAPAFRLPDQDGVFHKLSDYKGKWVLLYFYPKDMTPGCTKEACTLRDVKPDFSKLNAVVLGVSKDSPSRHQKFIAKESINFTLLSDESGEMIEKYGACAKKKMMGRTYVGILRISYLINPAGKITKVYEKVKPAEHAAEVLEDLRKGHTS